MLFDPFQWSEITIGKIQDAPEGLLQVMCSTPSALYVEAEGYEALAGFGTDFKVQVSGAFRFRLESPAKTRAFMYAPQGQKYEPSGEIFTNLDRAPMESESVRAVHAAVRQMKLEQRALMREMALERANLEAAREKTKKDKPEEKPAVLTEKVKEEAAKEKAADEKKPPAE